MKKFFKNNKGFTLIELLVVIAILAVLATLYVPRIVNSSNDAKKTVDIANARTLASEITMYNASHPDAIFKGTGTTAASGEGGAVAAYISIPSATLSGVTIVKKTDVEGNDNVKDLLNGRKWPSEENVLIVTDASGNCYIVQGTGGISSGAPVNANVGKPID